MRLAAAPLTPLLIAPAAGLGICAPKLAQASNAEAAASAVALGTLLIPAEPGIQGFVRLKQMGAPLPAVGPQLLALCGQALGYSLLAAWALRRRAAAIRSAAVPGLPG